MAQRGPTAEAHPFGPAVGRLVEEFARLPGIGRKTAERLATEYGIGRDEQDAFALESQRRAAVAIASNRFREELVPVPVPGRKGETTLVAADEHPRSDTTLEKLAKLPPVFSRSGTVSAGNSSGITDGAAATELLNTPRTVAGELAPVLFCRTMILPPEKRTSPSGACRACCMATPATPRLGA